MNSCGKEKKTRKQKREERRQHWGETRSEEPELDAERQELDMTLEQPRALQEKDPTHILRGCGKWLEGNCRAQALASLSRKDCCIADGLRPAS